MLLPIPPFLFLLTPLTLLLSLILIFGRLELDNDDNENDDDDEGLSFVSCGRLFNVFCVDDVDMLID